MGTPSRNQEKVTLGAPLARHINFPDPPLLLAALAICGDKSMSGDSVTKTTRELAIIVFHHPPEYYLYIISSRPQDIHSSPN